MSWRAGVRIANTSIWCDARRAREVCFASCAHAAAGTHGQLIATAPTLAVLAPRLARTDDPTHLPVPYGRPFTLGTVRLELVSSGHVPGSASLVADVAGRRVVYAGPINPRGNAAGERCDLRACDAVVIRADNAAALPPAGETRDAIAAFAREAIAADGAAALLLPSPSESVELAAHLASGGLELCAAPAIQRAAERLRAHYPELPEIPRWTARSLAGRVLLWPYARHKQLDAARQHVALRVALVSGHAAGPGALDAHGADAGFTWSASADPDEIARYLDACAARQIYFTGRHADALSAAFDRPDRPARPLGPPRQLSLDMRAGA